MHAILSRSWYRNLERFDIKLEISYFTYAKVTHTKNKRGQKHTFA